MYTSKSVEKKLLEPKPTFRPKVNKNNYTTKGVKRIELILEKGKDYEKRKKESALKKE